jgi:2-oxoglutarate dehydrogenase E2 component (dihydrolipoamide succinyltransferase)
MGESITEGTVIAWHKQVGDSVEQDETLLEIGTDKVDTEVPSPSAGKLAEVLVGEGDTVDVGTVIAVLETDVTVSTEVPAAAAPPPAAVAADTASPQPSQATAVAVLTDVVMPKMGESIMEGTIIGWHKQIGDHVDQDETLLEIATDKVDTDVPSPQAGILQEILVGEGETVDVGTVIARIGGGAAGASPTPAATPAPVPRSTATTVDVVAQRPSPDVSRGDGAQTIGESVPRLDDSGRFYSPLVRSIAEKEGVTMAELQSIGGSGREGRVTKKDLMAYVSTRPGQKGRAVVKPSPNRAPAPQPIPGLTSTMSEDGRVEIVEMDRMRKIIASHMVASKQTSAHVTSFAEVDVTNLVKLRESEKQAFLEREGVKLTFTPFFVKAAVDALREHPLLNSSVEGDKILMKKDFHIGIAVAIGTTGLVVPVIRTAGHKNIAGLARDAAVLAERARAKQLQPDDLQGGTFTVTNIGSLGSIMGTPIILQPQVAILATGAIKKRAVVIEDRELGDIIAVRHMMYVSLSYDHRIIDGAMSASYLHDFTQNVQAFKPGIEV